MKIRPRLVDFISARNCRIAAHDLEFWLPADLAHQMDGYHNRTATPELAARFVANAEVFFIDNVCEYLFSKDNPIPVREIHCILPPFPQTFFEWAVEGVPTGVYLSRQEEPTHYILEELFEGHEEVEEKLAGHERVHLICSTLCTAATVGRPPIFGTYQSVAFASLTGKFLCMVMLRRETHRLFESPSKLLRLCSNSFYATFFAIGFLHCKNVVVSDQRRTVGFQKKHRKLYGAAPRVKYKILHVKGMEDPDEQAVKRRKGSVGKKLSFHICRGHFKTFTEKNPLFGKLTGTYWWESYTRGSKKMGQVIKDYQVD